MSRSKAGIPPTETPSSSSKKRGKKGAGKGASAPLQAGPSQNSVLLEDDSDEDLSNELGVPLDAVVKIWCVHSRPNFSLPWQRRRQVRSSGSGFCIDLKRRAIL